MVQPKQNQKYRFNALPADLPKQSKIQPTKNYVTLAPITLPPPLQPEQRLGGHVTSFMRTHKTLNWVTDAACSLLDGELEEVPALDIAKAEEIPVEFLTLYDDLIDPDDRRGPEHHT